MTEKKEKIITVDVTHGDDFQPMHKEFKGKDLEPVASQSVLADYAQKVYDRSKETFICCALSGKWPQQRPELGPEYVRILQRMCREHATLVPFICFTDREIPGVVTRYLPPWLPGFWAKLFAFAPSNFPLGSRVLVLDLDTVVCGSLDEILAVPLDKPVFIRDAFFDQHACSGVFSFKVTTRTASIWNDFPHGDKGPPFQRADQPGKAGLKITDEHWMHYYTDKGGWNAWQDVLPGKVLSFKHDLHFNTESPPPEHTSIVYFDADPRPHSVIASWNPFHLLDPSRND